MGLDRRRCLLKVPSAGMSDFGKNLPFNVHHLDVMFAAYSDIQLNQERPPKEPLFCL